MAELRIAARLLACLPVVAGLCWALAITTSRVRADRLIEEAGAGGWAALKPHSPAATLQNSDELLRQALVLAPGDPAARELLGLVHSYRGSTGPDAVFLIRGALEFRPVSPYAWAALVEAQYRAGDVGRNLEYALQRAAELGPSEPDVQLKVAEYGMAVWDELSGVSQDAINRLLKAGFKRNSLELLQISERRGRLGVACKHLFQAQRAPNVKWSKLCQGPEAT